MRKENIMNRIKKMICSALLCAAVLAICAEAAGKSFSWYCVRKPDHIRPEADVNMRFVEDCGTAYIGKNPDEKVIYLTFDAGYENGNIARILDVLKAHDAHGAFFVLENIVKRDTALVKRMAEEGHLVCNHTSHHKNMTALSHEEFEREIRSLEEVLKEYADIDAAKFYRPPEGRFSEENLQWAQEMGYRTVLWSFAYADWDNAKQPDHERAKKLIFDNIHNGEVMLLHPTSETNADILDSVLTELENQGYRFGTLDELFE